MKTNVIKQRIRFIMKALVLAAFIIMAIYKVVNFINKTFFKEEGEEKTYKDRLKKMVDEIEE